MLRQGLGGSSKPGSSVIHKCFQGLIEVTTVDESKGANSVEGGKETTTAKSPFLLMSLDLPSTPLFKDSQGGNIIPQVRCVYMGDPFLTC